MIQFNTRQGVLFSALLCDGLIPAGWICDWWGQVQCMSPFIPLSRLLLPTFDSWYQILSERPGPTLPNTDTIITWHRSSNVQTQHNTQYTHLYLSTYYSNPTVHFIFFPSYQLISYWDQCRAVPGRITISNRNPRLAAVRHSLVTVSPRLIVTMWSSAGQF